MVKRKGIQTTRGNNNGKTEPKKNPEIKELKVNTILGKKVRVKCLNTKQKDYLNLIKEKEITIASGLAGTGKSYMAIATAIELLQNTSNSYNKILIIKPAVEAEENLGYLPGSLHEKLIPYLASSIDIVDKIIGKGNRCKLEDAELLVVESLGFIRGKTIDNSILIMEEAQNMSPLQMKTLLTRIGADSKYVISGDLDQSDKYKNFKKSGLFDAIVRLNRLDEIGFIEFGEDDIVRNPLIGKILMTYKENE